jgi:hypothetical protein
MSPSGCTGRRGVRLIVAFCGVTASGKSTVAARVAEASGFPVLSSDRVRKELAGLVPTERGPAERYGEAANRRTYDELAKRASSCPPARRRHRRPDGPALQRPPLVRPRAGVWGVAGAACECTAPQR